MTRRHQTINIRIRSRDKNLINDVENWLTEALTTHFGDRVGVPGDRDQSDRTQPTRFRDVYVWWQNQ